MNAHEKCDLQGPNDFIKMLEHELKSSSRISRRRSIGGRKSRKNGKRYKQKGGMNKEHVKFAVKCFIYLIFILVYGNGCWKIYTNYKFLKKVAVYLSISVEVLICVITTVMTYIKIDYKRKHLINVPFDGLMVYINNHIYALQKIADVVILVVKQNHSLNKYVDDQINDAFTDVDPTLTEKLADNQVFAQDYFVVSVSSFGNFIKRLIDQRQLENNDFDDFVDPTDNKEVVMPSVRDEPTNMDRGRSSSRGRSRGRSSSRGRTKKQTIKWDITPYLPSGNNNRY